MSSIPVQIPAYIDANAKAFVDRLARAVAIPSISGDVNNRKDVFAMADFLEGELVKLGVSVKRAKLGKQVLDGVELELPDAILGTLGSDKAKKTILLYGHFDVQPVCTSLISMDAI